MLRIYPVSLRLANQQLLQIDWSDGQRQEYAADHLRNHCPCASCRLKDGPPGGSGDDPSAGVSAQGQPLEITGMRPVGNYAYGITFSDGHRTGIYTLEHLRAIGRPAAADTGERDRHG